MIPVSVLLHRYTILFLGAVLLLPGLLLASGDIMCNGRVMQPGDTCAHKDGYTSYEQERDSTNALSTILLTVGGVMAAGAIARIVVVQRRRRAE